MQRMLDYLVTWVPAGWGNRNQEELPTPAVAHPHQNPETATLRSNAMITAKKILKAWKSDEFKKNFEDTFKCELKDCAIDMNALLDPLTSDQIEPKLDSMINLEPLRRQLAQGPSVITEDPVLNFQLNDDLEDLFLPRLIYIRQEMKGILNLFCRDVNLRLPNSSHVYGAVQEEASCIVKPYCKKTILLGSPGVGKSILCFLAALYRSRSTVTIYIRQTNVSSENVSVFIMFPEDDKTVSRKVRCLFTRSLDDQYLTELFRLKIFLEENLQLVRKEYYLFLDGPCYNSANSRDTLNGAFDYLCTSAGYPDFKTEEDGNSRCWIMCGWTEEEVEAAFVQMNPDTDTDEVIRKAHEAYALCGGKIRDLCRAFDDHEKMRKKLLKRVNYIFEKDVKFYLYSSTPLKVDKIRIVFRENIDDFDCDDAKQYVDSKFLRTVLASRLGLDRFVKDYKLADAMKNPAVVGWHLESTVHAWFLELVAGNQEEPLIKTVSDISNDNNYGQLIKEKKQYWVPSSRYSRNIDSAVVIDHTLYAFQVTVSDNHTFNVRTFFDDFLKTIKAFKINSVQVCVITTQENFAINPFLGLVRKPMRLGNFLENVRRDGWLQVVNIDSVEGFRQSMGGVLVEIRNCEEVKRATSTTAISGESNTLIRKRKDRKRKASTTLIPGDLKHSMEDLYLLFLFPSPHESPLRRSVRTGQST
jgi:hypothetical protein